MAEEDKKVEAATDTAAEEPKEEPKEEAATEAAPAEEAPAAEAEAVTEEDPVDTSGPGEVVNDWSHIVPGMVVRVHQKIKEMTPKGDERERIQVFAGTVIAKKGRDKNSATITVRKISMGVGVERIFPLRMPSIAKIEEVKQLRTRRSKLYYLRTHKKRLKEKKKS